MTQAPAPRASRPVASTDPSSTTMISRQGAASLSRRTTSAIESASSLAGITIDTADGSATFGSSCHCSRLRRKAEVDDIAVLHDVFLTFQADFAVVAARSHRTARRQRLIGDDLGADEPALNVAVNFAGGKLRGGAARDGPGAAFVFADREERHVTEQVVGGADHAI